VWEQAAAGMELAAGWDPDSVSPDLEQRAYPQAVLAVLQLGRMAFRVCGAGFGVSVPATAPPGGWSWPAARWNWQRVSTPSRARAWELIQAWPTRPADFAERRSQLLRSGVTRGRDSYPRFGCRSRPGLVYQENREALRQDSRDNRMTPPSRFRICERGKCPPLIQAA